MAKASKSLFNPAREVVQSALVDIVRRGVKSGAAYAHLGSELMAQGYAIVTGKDVAAARAEVAGMMGGGSTRKGAKKSARKTAKKKTAKKTAAKKGGRKASSKAGKSAPKKAAKKSTAKKKAAKRKSR